MSTDSLPARSRDTIAATSAAPTPLRPHATDVASIPARLLGKRVGMVVFSPYPADPRPRRAVDALLKQGMTVDLICEGEEKSAKRETLGSLDITRIPVKHYRGGVFSYAYQYSTFIAISAAILAWRTLRRRYDLVYVHNMPDVLIVSALIPKLFGAKVILDQHDPMPELMKTIFNLDESSSGVRVIKWLEKLSIMCADLVITVNVACKKIFAARSCRSEKIGVVMNSPDGEIFAYRSARSYSSRSSDKPFVIMYHGSLVERNGLDLAIQALAQARKTIPEAELRVYGESTPYLEKAMEKARTLGVQNHVRYMGPRKLEDLVGEIEACDVGVIPNHRNAFTDINTPTRIFEYLALGKPVIAPRTPGIQDYFGPEALFFFESGNSLELAERMMSAFSQPSQAIEIAERGQQVYLAHTWSEERQTLVDLVSRLLKVDLQPI